MKIEIASQIAAFSDTRDHGGHFENLKFVTLKFEALRPRNHETNKPRNRETKKPINQEHKKPRNQQTKKPRNQDTNKPRHFGSTQL